MIFVDEMCTELENVENRASELYMCNFYNTCTILIKLDADNLRFLTFLFEVYSFLDVRGSFVTEIVAIVVDRSADLLVTLLPIRCTFSAGVKMKRLQDVPLTYVVHSRLHAQLDRFCTGPSYGLRE